jgi:hypothetical protein
VFLSDNANTLLSPTKATGRVIIQDCCDQAAVDLAAVEQILSSAKLVSPLSIGAK